MSDKYASRGTALTCVAAEVGGISSIKGPSPEVNFTDTTSLDTGDSGDPVVALEDATITGYVATGSVTGEGFLDPADGGQLAMMGLIAAPESKAWTIVNSVAGLSCAFTGVLKKFETSAAVKDVLKFSFEIKLDSIPTFT